MCADLLNKQLKVMIIIFKTHNSTYEAFISAV